MPAPPEITALVEKFARRLNEYRSSCYNEEELRTEFVNPFFEHLGWDVGNRQGLPGDAREVKLEEAIRVEESIRNPDFTFRVDGKRKFFVETKKPSVNIEGGVYPAFQVRRYAWSAGLPLSILTDFEELAVYDCRAEPFKTDKPAKARLLYLQYDQYVERWDEIAALFSREAVLAGSLEKFVEAAPEKRGTKRVDTALLDEISGWREMLAKNIALRNPALSQKDLNFAVQRTIDRILFLRICEDRAIEEYGRLKALLEGDGVYARLLRLFEEADERYNSGIFHFREERDRKEPPDSLTLNLAVDDKVLKQIIQDLYFPDSPYVFSEIPAEILGQVYEQFLGKVIVLDESHGAEVEYKPEVRKAGGVYYTPGYIVEYIVKNTVGKLLEGKTPQEVSELRILDPACGSGSFLIGAYQYLLNWHKDWYVQNLVPLLEKGRSAASPEVQRLLPVAVERREDKRAKKIHARAAEASLPVFKANGNEWRLTTAERKRILLNNIYGVDIDPQAVEVTKLSLLLKVLEGETKESITSLLRYFRERALPDLGSNIKSGNSLIGWDILDDRPDPTKEELQRINPFDWQAEFPEVFQRGGFDAVIGNPPYVRSINLKENDPIAWNLYRSSYKSASKREWDIYLLFVEKGLCLLTLSGKLGYILPNKFLNSQVGEKLRSVLATGRHLDKILHFGAFQIFQGATTYTCLLFLDRRSKDKAQIYRYIGALNQPSAKCPLPEEASDSWITYEISNLALTEAAWELVASDSKLLDRLKQWPALGSIIQIFQGTGTRADKVYLVEYSGEENGLIRVYSTDQEKYYLLEPILLKPVLRGRSINRYNIIDRNSLLIVPYEFIDGKSILIHTERFSSLAPKTLGYLSDCKVKLEKRENGRFKGDSWYCYGRPQNMQRFDVPEKLVLPDVANRGTYTLDQDGLWLLDTTYGMIFKDASNINLKFILGILNSPILTYFLKETGTALRGGYFRMKTAYLNPFPIRTIDFSNPADVARHDRMVSLVERMLDLHKQLAATKGEHERTLLQRQIEATDRQIDALVYELYGLTEEEIRIVEETAK